MILVKERRKAGDERDVLINPDAIRYIAVNPNTKYTVMTLTDNVDIYTETPSIEIVRAINRSKENDAKLLANAIAGCFEKIKQKVVTY